MKSPEIIFIGAGNVASHLITFFLKEKFKITQIYNRSLNKVKDLSNLYNIPYTCSLKELKYADLYILCISDEYITEVSSQLLLEKSSIVVHTSGSTPLSSLIGNYRKGVFYPLQTFTKNKKLNSSDVSFFIEAEQKEDENLLYQLGKKLSEKTFILDSISRQNLHMAAVWINNFTNHLYFIAEQLSKNKNIPFSVFFPLITETASKITLEKLPPFEAQTGPAKRKDLKILNQHLYLLKDNPYYQTLYKAISESIIHTYP